MNPRSRLKALRAELRYHQLLNRLAIAQYRAGARKVKEIAAEMRAVAVEIDSQRAKARRS